MANAVEKAAAMTREGMYLTETARTEHFYLKTLDQNDTLYWISVLRTILKELYATNRVV